MGRHTAVRRNCPNRSRPGGAAAALIASAALVLSAGTAAAQTIPPADSASIVTLQDENASISTSSLTDRYYVNGLRLGYVSPTDITPDWMQRFGDVLFGAGRERVQVDIAQGMFTPADTQLLVPKADDRPYAGTLQLTASLIHDTDDTRNVIALSLGVLGPGSGARDLQDSFHDAIGQGHDAGWPYQLGNEPIGQVLVERIWRLPLGGVDGLEFDVLPSLTAAAGNIRTYAMASAIVRVGQGLESDYGVPRIRPGVDGTDAYDPVRPFAWYFFAGGDGQAVANDLTFDTEDAPYFTDVAIIHDVGEAEAGAAVIWHGVRVSYTQVFQTHEFVGQRSGLHQFGSLAGSVRF